MNALWSYFWPALGAGAAIGILAGAFAFRRRARRNLLLGAGVVLAVAFAALWHGPLGAADRFAARVERNARQVLVDYLSPPVAVHVHHGPLTRQLVLSGHVDEYQSDELVRLLSQVPGVSHASWSARTSGLPLIVEGTLAALVGFLVGAVLAYLVELRRRYNAQWKW
jgi:hypothetical protein